MKLLDQFSSGLSIVSQAVGLGILLYGMATGATATIAVGVIVTSLTAMTPSREGSAAEG